jgi:hypothetical protein
MIQLPEKYGHLVAGREGGARGVLANYVLSGNGLFIRAERRGLKVSFPLFEYEVRGLPELSPSFEMSYPRVRRALVAEMLSVSARAGALGLENLFHFTLEGDDGWELHDPPQSRTGTSCRPREDGPGSTYERAFIEAHSHHAMRCYFSRMDDRDETGFRLYAVVGDIPRAPKIRVRVGVYGHFWQIPAAWIFDLPDELEDLNSNG